jgi:hypothetical protein
MAKQDYAPPTYGVRHVSIEGRAQARIHSEPEIVSAATPEPKVGERGPEIIAPQNKRIDPNFLDRSVSAILPDLEGKSNAELRAIYDAEKHGKTRKSLMGPLGEMLNEKDS